MGHFKLKVVLLASFVLVLQPEVGYSQTKLEVERFSALDGISGKVREMQEDDRGNLWLLTSSQVYRYSPAGSQSYDRFDGLPSDAGELHTVFVDDQDQIWIGTQTGLLKLDPAKEEFLRASEEKLAVEEIRTKSEGSLWLANDQGVLIADGKGIDFLADFPGDVVLNDMLPIAGKLLLATSEGVFSLSSMSGNLKQVASGGTGAVEITQIASTEKGILLGTRDRGLLLMAPDLSSVETVRALPYSARQLPITGISVDQGGNIYVATLGEGLVSLDKDLELIAHYRKEDNGSTFLDNRLGQVYLDAYNRLWISSETGGFYQMNLRQNIFELVGHQPGQYGSLAHDFTTAIEEDQNGNIWFGSKEGLSIWNRKYDSWQHIKNLSFSRSFPNPDIIKDLQADDEHMWVATHNDGVYKVNINTLLRAHYSKSNNKIGFDKASALELDRQKNLWIAGEDGDLTLIKRNGKIEEIGLQGASVLLWSRSGDLYAAGKRGIFRIASHSSQPEKIDILSPNAGDLSYLNINMIRESSQGEILLATDGAGVVIYDPEQNTYQVIGEKEGLPSQNIRAIEIFGRNDVWAVSATGLSQFRISKIPEVRNFGEDDGLASTNFTGSVAQFDNRLAFGTVGGVEIFNPADVKRIPVNLPLVSLAQVTIGTKTTTLSGDTPEAMKLQEGEDAIGFTFGGSQPGSDSPLLYSWRLLGLEEAWSQPQPQNTASFSNLTPGMYTFEVRGLGSDGSWSEIQKLPFRVQPPWYLSSTAFLILAGVILLTGFLLLIFSRILKQKRRRETQSAIFASMNQEFGTSLNIILSTLDNIAEAEDLTNKNRLHIVINRLRELMEPILNFQATNLKKKGSLQLTKITVREYFEDLLADIRPLLREKNLEVILNNQWNREHLIYDVVFLNKIFFNVLSNSIKYCTQDAKIIINLIGTNKGDMKVQITDNGLGMPEKERKIVKEYFRSSKGSAAPKEPYHLNTLLAVKDFLDKAGGAIFFESSRNEGTTFTLILKNYPKAVTAGPERPEVVSAPEVATASEPANVEAPRPPVETFEAPLPREEMDMPTAAIEKKSKSRILVVSGPQELEEEVLALQQLGKVEQVQNIFEAYERALEAKPDIIVAGSAAGTNGSVLWKALQKNDALRAIPVYLIYEEPEFPETSGITNTETLTLVRKPNNPENLVALLAQRQEASAQGHATSKLPERNSKILRKDSDEDIVQKLQKLILQNADESSFSIEELSKAMGVRRMALESVIEDCKGMALDEFIIETKLEYARGLIHKGDSDLSEVARKAGFKNKDIFFFLYKRHFGFMPGRIIEKQ